MLKPSNQVDIIIPTYNRASTLTRAIESVMTQTYPHWRLWLIDDGSTDETEDLAAKYVKLDKRFHYLKIENSGVSHARNLGVSKGEALWLAFLDSDDEWLPNKLTEQFEYLALHPQLNLVYSDEIWMRKGKRVNPKSSHQKKGGAIFCESMIQCLIGPSTVLMKRALFNEMGGFRDDFIACEDYDLWLKITSLYEVGFIARPHIIKYGGHADQLSTTTECMDYWRVLSLDWIYENRTLGPDELSALKTILLGKAQILRDGHLKRQKIAEAQEMQNFIYKYEA